MLPAVVIRLVVAMLPAAATRPAVAIPARIPAVVLVAAKVAAPTWVIVPMVALVRMGAATEPAGWIEVAWVQEDRVRAADSAVEQVAITAAAEGLPVASPVACVHTPGDIPRRRISIPAHQLAKQLTPTIRSAAHETS